MSAQAVNAFTVLKTNKPGLRDPSQKGSSINNIMNPDFLTRTRLIKS